MSDGGLGHYGYGSVDGVLAGLASLGLELVSVLDVGEVARVVRGEEGEGEVEVYELNIGGGVRWGMIDQMSQSIRIDKFWRHLYRPHFTHAS